MPLALAAPLPSYRPPQLPYQPAPHNSSSLPSSPSPLSASFPSSAPHTSLPSGSSKTAPLPPFFAFSASSACSTSMSSPSPTISEGDRTDEASLRSSRASSEDGGSSAGRLVDGVLDDSGNNVAMGDDENLLRRLDQIGRWEEHDEAAADEEQGSSGNVLALHVDHDKDSLDSNLHRNLLSDSISPTSLSSSPSRLSRTTPSSPNASQHSTPFFRGTSHRVLTTRTTTRSTVSLASNSECGISPKEVLGLEFLPEGDASRLEPGEEEHVELRGDGIVQRKTTAILSTNISDTGPPLPSFSPSPSHSRRSSQSQFSLKAAPPVRLPSIDHYQESTSASFTASSRRQRVQSSIPQYSRSPVFPDARLEGRAGEASASADGSARHSLAGRRKLKSTPPSQINLSSFFVSPFSPTIPLPNNSPSSLQRSPFSSSPSDPSTPSDEKGPSELYHNHQHIVPRSVTNALTSPIYPLAHLLTFLLISLTAVFAFSGVLLGSYSLRVAESVSRRVAIKAGVVRPPPPPTRLNKPNVVKKRRGVVEEAVEKGKDAAEGVVNVVRESAVDWVRRSFPDKVAGLMVVQGVGSVGVGGAAGKKRDQRLPTSSSRVGTDPSFPTLDLKDSSHTSSEEFSPTPTSLDSDPSQSSTAISSPVFSAPSKKSSRRNSRSANRPSAFAQHQRGQQPPRPPLTLLLASIVLTIIIAGVAVVLGFFKHREEVAVPDDRRKRRSRESSGEGASNGRAIQAGSG